MNKPVVEYAIALGVAATCSVVAFKKIIKHNNLKTVTVVTDIDEDEIMPDDDFLEDAE